MAAGLYIHIPFVFPSARTAIFTAPSTPRQPPTLLPRSWEGKCKTIPAVLTRCTLAAAPLHPGPQVLTGILQAVRDHFTIDPAAEITVECNPSKDLTGDMEQYAAAGINRVSIGMQSAVDRERFALGRRAGSGEVARTVAAAKAAGITNISLDVMLEHPQTDPGQLGGNLCLY